MSEYEETAWHRLESEEHAMAEQEAALERERQEIASRKADLAGLRRRLEERAPVLNMCKPCWYERGVGIELKWRLCLDEPVIDRGMPDTALHE